MIRIGYAEDDAETAAALKRYIERYAKEHGLDAQTQHFENAETLMYDYTCRFDLLLLDIQLGGMTGMEAAEAIRKVDSSVIIIFITSLVQYAVKGYEVDALDFVVKPVGYDQFALKMDRAVRMIGRREYVTLPVSTQRGTKMLSSRDVQYVEVSNHDLIYHTDSGVYRTRGSLGALEEKLRERHFLRVSVSHLVNLEYIDAVDGSALLMKNGDTVWISRARKREVMAGIAGYLGGSV